MLLILLLAFSLNVRAESVVDKLAGSWKLNPAKSKLVSDIAEQTMKIEKIGSQTVRVSVETTTKSGEKRPLTFERVCDGKGHQAQAFGTGRAEICDPATGAATFLREGKPGGQLRLTFSPDGKSHTVTRSGTNAAGKLVEESLVFEKQ
jgi:hypothetical protein